MWPNYFLRGTLLLIGTAILMLGINVGLGGIRTLGWQGGMVEFLTVTNSSVYEVRDNHIRFIGGVWLAAGLLVMAGAFWLRTLRVALAAIAGMVFVGGLCRFSALDPALLANWAIAPSVVFELIGFPLIGLWVLRAERE